MPPSSRTPSGRGARLRGRSRLPGFRSVHGSSRDQGHPLLGIDKLRVYDIDPASAAKFARNVGDHGFHVQVCESRREAVIGADIITTATADKRIPTILSAPRLSVDLFGLLAELLADSELAA